MQNLLFGDTVTVYRPGIRQVVAGCCYRWELREEESETGMHRKAVCRLVVTGTDYLPQVGDLVFPGEGPEKAEEDFLPGQVPGLSRLSWVRPYFLFGKLHHVEAGC